MSSNCPVAYSEDDINKEPIPLNLVAMQEYLRSLVRRAGDRGDLSIATGVKYGRLSYFAQNEGTTLSIADMQKLMEHFGLVRSPVAA